MKVKRLEVITGAIAIVMLITMIVGVTYAFFNPRFNLGNNRNVHVTTIDPNNLPDILSIGAPLNNRNLNPICPGHFNPGNPAAFTTEGITCINTSGQAISFTVMNTTTLLHNASLIYNVYLTDIEIAEEFKTGELRWNLRSTAGNPVIAGKNPTTSANSGTFINIGNAREILLLENVLIPHGQQHQWNFRIGLFSNPDMVQTNAIFSGRIRVVAGTVASDVCTDNYGNIIGPRTDQYGNFLC